MKKTSRKLNCSYLYADGTLVQVFDERRDGISIAQTVDITRGWCDVSIRPAYSYGFELRQTLEPRDKGRIVIHDSMHAFVTLAKGGRVRSHAPDVQSGSENTRSRGIAVQYVEVITKNGLELHWSECTGILSSCFTVQADGYECDFDNKSSGDRWGDMRIWKVVDLRPRQLKEVAA